MTHLHSSVHPYAAHRPTGVEVDDYDGFENWDQSSRTDSLTWEDGMVDFVAGRRSAAGGNVLEMSCGREGR